MSSANISTQKEDEEDALQTNSELPITQDETFMGKLKANLKKNWIILVVLFLVIGIYIGLRTVKNSLNHTTGDKATYHNPDAPDYNKDNKDKEERQRQNDRVSAANQASELDDNMKESQQDSSQKNLTRYSAKDAYKKLLANQPAMPTVASVPVVEPKTKVLVSETVATSEKKITNYTAHTRSRNSEVFYERERKIAKTANENSGFNTVVLAPQNNQGSSNSISKKKSEYVRASIYGNQTVRSGSQVRVRMLDSFIVDGEEIPANSLCTGVVMLGGNRVNIALTSVNAKGRNIPIRKVVLDKDLLMGIVFNSENAVQQGIRQNKNAGIDQTSSSVLNTISSIGGVGGLAGAGISAGVGIVSGISHSIRYGGVQKRTGEIQLEEGYKIFIKNE